MRTLIVEDDFYIRKLLKTVLSQYGDCDTVVDGAEAIQAFLMAWQEEKPYDLICLDIMMPNMNGHEALQKIRDIEKEMMIKGSKEVKVIMITALNDPKSVFEAYYKGGATYYMPKPIKPESLVEEVRNLGLIE